MSSFTKAIPTGLTSAAAVDINGGAIDGTTIGATTPAAITGTTVNATTFDTNVAAAGVTLAGTTLSADGTDANINIAITPKGTGEVDITKIDCDGGAIDGTVIGATTPAAATVTNLSVIDDAATLTANFRGHASSGMYVRFQSGTTIIGYIGSGNQIVAGGAADSFGIDAGPSQHLILGAGDAQGAKLSHTTLNFLIGTAAEPTPAARLVVKGSTADGSTDCLALQDSAGVAQLTVNTDGVITLGTDTNLYRSAANVLKTDDNFQAVGNVETASDKAFLLGADATNGSWRFVRDGNNLLVQRYDTSAWVTKQTISA